MDEFRTKLSLKGRDLLADSRLADASLPGDGGKTSSFNDSNEHLHRVEFVQVRLPFRLSESTRQGSYRLVAQGSVYPLAESPTGWNGDRNERIPYLYSRQDTR